MKKYLLSALALPLLFACSSEDYLDQKATGNDPFAGIEKVDATFTMDEGQITRMDNGTGWELENGDLYGFAWLTDAHTADPAYTPKVNITGDAFQNHNLIQTKGRLEPQTSIYVGKYFIYRPYDKTTTAPAPINFNSLKEQTLAEGQASGYGTDVVTPWKKLAETAIIIGDKWTEILPAGHTYTGDETVWDKPGIGQPYKVYAAFFSNQTGLDLKYEKNNPTFTADKEISGATDIKHTFKAGTAVGAADIYKAEVTLTGAANSFTYAPTVEPNNETYPKTVDGKKVYHNRDFWAGKMNLAAVTTGNPGDGFVFANGAITLNSPDADEDGVLDGISTGDNGSKGWFWFNSLPVTAGNGALNTVVTPVLETSYGTVTVKKSYSPDVDYTVGNCAYVLDKYNASATAVEWIKLADADAAKTATTPATWKLDGDHNTFINQYGNHKGKYALTVDFSKGVMNNMHIKNDDHLQKLLKYYIASGKTETGVVLNLDGDANKEFKISKISIALLQTINKTTANTVLVKACGTHNNPVKIIVTQDGQDKLGLADAKEVPALNKVFAEPTRVYLAAKNSNGADITWTWGGDYDGDEVAEFDQALPIDANVRSVRNLGTITVNATNLELSINTQAIYNEAGATMNITKVTTAKSSLINYGTINVGSTSNTDAQLRAYGREIKNDATDAKDLTKRGTINNYGVIGTSDGTAGQVNNYGEINVMNDAAITLLKSNELGLPAFASPFGDSKKMGSVVIPSPFALVSVSNGAENGFIKYTWPAATTTYATPTGGVVKYNTIIVSNDIAFTKDEAEIQYIEFNGTRTQVVNPSAADDDPGYLDNLKGIIVNAGKSIIIEKTNGIVIPATGSAFLGAGATVYKGGRFVYPATAPTNNYFGPWTPADQVVVW